MVFIIEEARRISARTINAIAGKTLSNFPKLNKIAQASPEAFHYWLLTNQCLAR